MENEWEKAFRLSKEIISYDAPDHYSYNIEEARIQMYHQQLAEKMKLEMDAHYTKAITGIGFSFDDTQRAKDITHTMANHKVILEGLAYTPELIMRVENVQDITELSHDIRRSCVYGVFLKYERQQNRLDIYFEKAQDYVLVKMFTE